MASFSAAKAKSSAGTRSALDSVPATHTRGRVFQLTRGRSSGARSNPMLAQSGPLRRSANACSPDPRWRASRRTRPRSTESPVHAARGTTSRSGRRPRAKRMYQAAYVSASPAVSRIPWRGQARSRFSPNSSRTGGSRSASGSARHSIVAASLPPASHARSALWPHRYTRNTCAESAARVPRPKPEARANARSAVSSAARAHPVSAVGARWAW